jgi:hypothetical protein
MTLSSEAEDAEPGVAPLLAELGVVPLRRSALFRRAIGPEPATYFPGDSLRSAWPGHEFTAQRIDVLLAEPVAKELLIGNAVELDPCITVVLGGQAGVETASEADQLGGAIAVQHPRDIGVIAWFDTARQRADLPADYVFQRQDRADLREDRRPAAVEVGHLQHGLLTASSGDDPFGQPLTQSARCSRR